MATVISFENICVSPTVARLLSDLTGILKQDSSPLDGLRGELECLRGKFAAVQVMLEDAEQKQLSDEKVKDWLREVRESACDAEDVLDSLMTEGRLQERYQVRNLETPSVVSQWEAAARKIRDLLDRLGGIDEGKKELLLNPDRENGAGNEWRRETDTSHLEAAHYVTGRDNDKSNLLKRLLADDPDDGGDGISVIPIIGMGGLGKTTLSRLVFNDKGVKEHFDSRMWVCVTDDFDYKRILREMIRFHSKMVIDSNLSEDILESRLLEFLKGKPFLLVLDDVWPERCQEWGKLRSMLSKGGKASRVLITSRNENVSEIMGTLKPYSLGCLLEDECLSLFNAIAFRDRSPFNRLRKELDHIGKGIVRKCKGLPLAVKAMAGLLRGIEDVNKWKEILRSEIWEVEEKNRDGRRSVQVLPALQLSYNNLPPPLKQCFAYCSIFPKSYVFQKQDLVKLWMAGAFLQTRDVDKNPLKVGSEYFDELLMRSFFQISSVDNKVSYTMHDLIHDMAISISKPYCFQVKGNGSIRSSEASRHISLICRHAEQPLFEVIANSKKLRTLLFPTDYLKNFGQALDTLLHSVHYIRALDLSSSELKQLPDSIAKLKLLRYLDLSETEIRELPNSVCRLYNLETLKLRGCRWLYELPEDLGDLVNLCHLELDDMFWFKASKLPPRMGNLTKLQNLHKFIVGKDPGYGIEELSRLACLDGTLHLSKLENARDAAEAKLKEKTNLRTVVFEWTPTSDSEHEESDHMRVFESLQPHKNLTELQVSHYKGGAFPGWLRDDVFGNIVVVSLSHCVYCRTLSIGQLPNLRVLNLKGMTELEEWQGEWPSLTRLKVSRCPKLRTLPPIFPNMRVMEIKMCDSLEVLPLTPSLQFLILDSNSSLKDWHEAHKLIFCPNEQGQAVVRQVGSFHDLLELKVTGCPKLEGLPNMFAPQKLEIHNCELICRLPPPHFACRLQHLALVGCNDDTLVRLIPYTTTLYSLVISGITELSTFPEWPHLPGLKALYIHDCPDLESLSSENGGSLQVLASVTLLSVQNCPKLKEIDAKGLPLELECLSIASCPKLESLGPVGTLTSRSKLKDVYILDCPMLHLLPEDGFPISVQHLYLENCPSLRARCHEENGGGPDWPKIKDIPDLEMFDYEVSSPSPSPADHAQHVPSQMPISPGGAQASTLSYDLSQSESSSSLNSRPTESKNNERTCDPGQHVTSQLPISSGRAQASSTSSDLSHLEFMSSLNTASPTESKNNEHTCGSESVSINELPVHDPGTEIKDPSSSNSPPPMTSSMDDEFENICKDLFDDIDNDLRQFTSNQISDVDINEALSVLRSFFSLDPADASDPERQSSSLYAALLVLQKLDQSFDLTGPQVDGLNHLVRDWRRIAGAASAAKKEQQQLREQLSASIGARTKLLDLESRYTTLNNKAKLLKSQDEELQLELNELEKRLEEVKSQDSRIKTQRSTNFDKAKQLHVKLNQLRREATQRVKEAENLLVDSEQQWGSFRDVVVEVASHYSSMHSK